MGAFFAGTLLSVATILIAAPLKSVSARYAYAIIFSAAYLCGVLIWVFWQSIGQTAFAAHIFCVSARLSFGRRCRGGHGNGGGPAIKDVAADDCQLLFRCRDDCRNSLCEPRYQYPRWFFVSFGRASCIAFSVAFAMLLFVRRSLWFAPARGVGALRRECDRCICYLGIIRRPLAQ